MDFYEVVDKVVDLLRSRGRVTYSSLKIQFQLDDAQVAALREEILYAHESTVQADERGLKWDGETDSAVEPDRTPHPEPQPVVKSAAPTPVKSPPVESNIVDAERRQLTVMFCDLVGSTSLSGELDPEDLREVVQAYQADSTEVIQRYEGYVAQHLGDGILCYFGYPTAHEDDAHRAVRAGLGIIDEMKTLNLRLEQTHGIQLAVRISIHTGVVVVGGIGAGERQEQLALGETPNVAARIQSLAEPNTVVISADTHRLVQGYFDCELLGEHDLRGVSQRILMYRVLQESGVQSRLDIASPRGLTPLVGREQEVGLLLERWGQAREGQGQVVLLSGEAGIGKSRLVQALKDHVTDESHTRLECRSSPYFTNSALYPVIDLMQRKMDWQQDDTSDNKLVKLEQNLSQYQLPLEETVPLFATLLSLPVPEDRYRPLPLTPQRQRQKTLESIVSIIQELSERQPVLFILEDLHWTDPTTLEFIDLLIAQIPTASVYAQLTCRPEYQPSWSHRSYLTAMTLNRLSRQQVERLATQVASEKTLPSEVIEQLVEKADGVPLYVEEMTKSVLESGVLKESDGPYELTGPISSLAIPATLQDSLMARLDRLVTAKAVAQYAAVIGRQFSYELLQAVSQLDETTLQRELGRLVDAELVYQRGLPPQTTYFFKHALVQDSAYQSLLRRTRQGYHRRIAEVLEEQFPETAEYQPELLAHHFTEAGLNELAIRYWHQAGERASDRSAYQEGISHLTTGLTLLQTLPETLARHQQELPLQTALGAASLIARGQGAPEVEAAYTRARTLCQQLGDTEEVFPVLLGLWRFYHIRADYPLARQLGEDLLGLAERRDEMPLYVVAHYTLGATCLWTGEPRAAHRQFEEGMARYTSAQQRSPMFRAGQDPGVACRVFAACALWVLGYPDQALARAHDGLALATKLDHPFSDAFALFVMSMIWQIRREDQEVYNHAEAAVTLSTEQGFALWLAWGNILRAWALTAQGQREVGLTQIRQGLMEGRTSGAELLVPYFLTLLAEGYGTLEQVEAGLDALREGLEVMERTGEYWWKAEMYRLKGELLLLQATPDVAQAESYFHQALDVSRHQQAKSLELRAATSLARLWQSQGKQDEAREVLEPVYSWFTEGFDTADLIDAIALLDELTEGQP